MCRGHRDVTSCTEDTLYLRLETFVCCAVIIAGNHIFSRLSLVVICHRVDPSIPPPSDKVPH